MELSKAILSIINNEYQTNPTPNEIAWKLRQNHSDLIGDLSVEEVEKIISDVYLSADHPYLTFRRKIFNAYFLNWFQDSGKKISRQDLKKIFQDADNEKINTERLAEDLLTDLASKRYRAEDNIPASATTKREKLLSSNWVSALPEPEAPGGTINQEIAIIPIISKEPKPVPSKENRPMPEVLNIRMKPADIRQTNPSGQAKRVSSPFKWIALIVACFTILIILYYYGTGFREKPNDEAKIDGGSHPVPVTRDSSVVTSPPVPKPKVAIFQSLPNIQYENASYDIFLIKIEGYLARNLTIVTNIRHLSEAAFFNSLSASLKRPFFAITASSVGTNCAPPGLLTVSGVKRNNLNIGTGEGNFFLKPNGVIFMDQNGKVAVENTDTFNDNGSYLMAVQAGPMLVINGQKHPVFEQSSTNKNIRCGVGTYKKDNEDFLVFIKSREPITFYQLFQIFQEKYNCFNALNLEGSALASIHLPNILSPYRDKPSVCRYLVITLPD